MTTTTTAGRDEGTVSRTPLLATVGVAAAALITAVGTFGDLTGNESGEDAGFGEYLVVLGFIVVGAAVVFGLVVRTAEQGNPARRSLILGIVGALSIAVFWSGLPAVLAAGATACALTDRDRRGRWSGLSGGGVVLAALTVVAAVVLAIVG